MKRDRSPFRDGTLCRTKAKLTASALLSYAAMKQKIQITLLIGMLIAGIRLAIILYDRHEDAIEQTKKPAVRALNPDYYVTPKKQYPYDLRWAKQLTKQPVWVKVGYAYSYYPYDTVAHHADFSRETGKLLPIQKLAIKDIVTGVSPKDPGERQILAVFEHGGKRYATPIGIERDGDYKFYSDDMLFLEDPHQLYKHWPADVWQAIDQHQVKPGMGELEADFAVGIGMMESGGDSINRTLDYPNGGKLLSISYHDGRAVDPGATG